MSVDQSGPKPEVMWLAAYGDTAFFRFIASLIPGGANCDPRARGSYESRAGGAAWGSRADVEEWMRRGAGDNSGCQ